MAEAIVRPAFNGGFNLSSYGQPAHIAHDPKRLNFLYKHCPMTDLVNSQNSSAIGLNKNLSAQNGTYLIDGVLKVK